MYVYGAYKKQMTKFWLILECPSACKQDQCVSNSLRSPRHSVQRWMEMEINFSLSLCRMWEVSPVRWTGREWESHFWLLRLCCRWSDCPSFCCLKVCVFPLSVNIHSQSRIEVCHLTEPPKCLVLSQLRGTLSHYTSIYHFAKLFQSLLQLLRFLQPTTVKEPKPTNTLTKQNIYIKMK